MDLQRAGILDEILHLAAQEAVNSGAGAITPAHLLMALSRASEAPVGSSHALDAVRQEFDMLGVQPRMFRRRLRSIVGGSGERHVGSALGPSSTCRALLERAQTIANTEHVGLAPVHLVRAAFAQLGDLQLGPESKDEDSLADVPAEL